MKSKYKIALGVIGVLFLITMFIGSSYAMWTVTVTQTDENTLSTGCFELKFNEKTSSITLDNAYPITDTDGLATRPYTFTLTNKCDYQAEYRIYLNKLQTSRTDIPEKFVKYSLAKTSEAPTSGKTLLATEVNTDVSNFSYNGRTLTKSYYLDELSGKATGVLSKNESVEYNLRVWIDENACSSLDTEVCLAENHLDDTFGFEAALATVAYSTNQ